MVIILFPVVFLKRIAGKLDVLEGVIVTPFKNNWTLPSPQLSTTIEPLKLPLKEYFPALVIVYWEVVKLERFTIVLPSSSVFNKSSELENDGWYASSSKSIKVPTVASFPPPSLSHGSNVLGVSNEPH